MYNYILLYLTVTTTITSSTPIPGKKDGSDGGRVLYDQRQEGEWNVRADLKNFVILIIPTQTSSSPSSPSLVAPTSSSNFLDFLTKSLPSRSHLKQQTKQPDKIKEKVDVAEETMHFIESKTAPYHVDISRSRNQLAKLHPEIEKQDDVFVANSPSVQLLKNIEAPVLQPISHSRISRAFLVKLPQNEEFIISNTEDHKKVVKKDVKKKTIKEVPKHSLKLLGAENEQCGPGTVRDSYGNCRVFDN